MDSFIEAVPNVSEGRDPEVIGELVRVISSVPGAYLLHTDSGAQVNRTVFTIAGAPVPVTEACFRLAEAADRLIDLTKQTGTHRRMGTLDVCPLVPLQNVSPDEIREWTGRLGNRIADELDKPVYFYAQSAASPERAALPDLRKGGPAGVQSRIDEGTLVPDLGPHRVNPRKGALALGVRALMAAYNINLKVGSPEPAREIARLIRSSGDWVRDAGGLPVTDAQGQRRRQPGLFEDLQADGWYIQEFERAQVTCNLHHLDRTPLHKVFEAVKTLASARGITVTGSEIVGMVPESALVAAGRHYDHTGDPIRAGIRYLGLNDVRPFRPEDRLIEWRLKTLQND